MRIIGVIDIRFARAVHARAGDRSAYLPIERAAGVNVDGDVEALARVYVERLGVRELYVADLDAIARGVFAMNAALIARVAALGVPVWVDAGVSTAVEAARVIETGSSTVIVGLETLSSFDALARVCDAIGRSRVAFSLDLRDGAPITMPNGVMPDTVESLVRSCVESGAGSVVVLDLARVGTGSGIDLELMSRVRAAAPDVSLFSGGGLRNNADLDALERIGVNGALVATALLNGSIKV